MMIHEPAFHDARRLANPLPCAFESALLARRYECRFARGLNIAEREALGCADAARRETCVALHGHLRRNAAFALKLGHPLQPISHAREMQVQCGGLIGLQIALFTDAAAAPTCDISAMVDSALRKYGTLDKLPFSEIIRAVAAFQPRRRHV